MLYRITLAFFCCCTAQIPAYTQNYPDLQFTHITAKDGLISDAVSCITEDMQGFIWVGTGIGLTRWDGYRFKYFFHSNADSNSLVNNDIQRIYCDKNNRLWISTSGGVSVYDIAQNKFTNYNTGFEPLHNLKNYNSVRIYEDEKNNIWLCNQNDVIYKVKQDMTLEEVKINLPPFFISNTPMTGYDGIYRDKEGNEWAFKSNRVYQLNKKTKQPVKMYDFSRQTITFILDMLQDENGNYWLTTWGGGMFRFFPNENLIVPVKIIPTRVYPDIMEWDYKGNKYLLAIESTSGLYISPDNFSTVKKFSFVPGDLSALHGGSFTNCFIDRRNNLWISSNMGINLVKAEQNFFDLVPLTDPGTPNYDITHNGIGFSYFETDSSFWLSKRYASTFEYDKNFKLKNFFRQLYPLSSKKYHTNGSAYDFYKKNNELFISTDSGLVVYDLVRKISHEYFPGGNYPNGFQFRNIVAFNKDEILIRTFENGLFVFNTVSKKFSSNYKYQQNCKDCLPVRLRYLFKTNEGDFFVTTDLNDAAHNFFKYDAQSDTFKPIEPKTQDNFLLSSASLFGMDEDSSGNIWIASSKGIFIYNVATNNISKPLEGDNETGGLFRICLDKYGDAWANSNSGIWCYVKSTGKWIHFNAQDGLPGSDFEGVLKKTNNGNIVAGLEGAIAIFYPDTLLKQNAQVPAYITEAAVGKNNYSFLNNPNKQLTIEAGITSFSVDFALLNYMSPASSRFYYKLDPIMENMQQNDNGHINFNGLPPGTYALHVRGGNKTGNIFVNEDVLKIIVRPKWFQTRLFKAGAILCLALFIFFFASWRIHSIKKQSFYKEKIAETEMQALRAQMNPHFIFNSLNSIENFIMQNEKRLASDYLNKFARLIRMILDSSRNEVVPVAKDMEALNLYVELELLRFHNKFSYHSHVDPQLLQGDFRVPSLLIQPYVENAIVHGIAHSDKKDLQLTVTATLENDKIKYTIQDNGVGRKQASVYNKQNKPGHKSIGLKITENRIAHFNMKEHINGAVKITDLYTDDKQSNGTKVEVLVKTI